MALLYIITPGKDSFLLRFPAWYPRGPEHNADEAHQVHQEADTPADVCQKAGQQRGDDAAHLVHGR